PTFPHKSSPQRRKESTIDAEIPPRVPRRPRVLVVKKKRRSTPITSSYPTSTRTVKRPPACFTATLPFQSDIDQLIPPIIRPSLINLHNLKTPQKRGEVAEAVIAWVEVRLLFDDEISDITQERPAGFIGEVGDRRRDEFDCPLGDFLYRALSLRLVCFLALIWSFFSFAEDFD